MRLRSASVLILLFVLSVNAVAQVTPIGPFTGTALEQFTNPTFLPSYQTYDIWGGFGNVRNIHPSGALKYEFSSERGGDLVLPRSAPTFGGQIGISEWTFDAPLERFGAYWENNSRFNDGVATFYDVNNNLLATMPMTIPMAAQTWTWNGWQFTTPVNRIVVTGNDTVFFGGFIWYEDATYVAASVAVPEVSSLWMMVAVGVVAVGWWKRKALASLVPSLRLGTHCRPASGWQQ
jgi:hypothetical protein